ncbi:MAG TPA: alpha/beta hydrolase [Rhodanobacteraceae bacterium]
MKLWISAFFLLVLCVSAQATTNVWQPTAGHVQVPIWPGTPPDARPAPGPENITVSKNLVAGRPWLAVANVTRPTMTVYAPKGVNAGAAVVVFPGGGFRVLAIDLEGTEICHWLTSTGITCVLLKYRVPGEPFDWKCQCYDHGADAVSTPALQDAQRTIRLVRAHAAKWHVDPHKIGVIGFSAGGYLVGEVSADFNQPSYKPVDAVDTESDRPDFAMAIYPGHMVTHQYLAQHANIRPGHLNPNMHFTHKTPPTFIVQAENDDEDSISSSLAYYTALVGVGVPAELHLYAKGGHAFGLRPTRFPITGWPKLATTWLHTIGVLDGK